MDSYKKIIEDTVRIISFHRALGIGNYPLTKGVIEFLKTPVQVASHPARKESGKVAASQTKIVAQTTTTGTLANIRSELGDCTRCTLHQGRTAIIFGRGIEKAKLFIVGEWPSRQDDQSGEIFSGVEGEMLDKMLVHVLNMKKEEVYLSSVLKCKVSEENLPDPLQVRSCSPFLLDQISVVQPEIICAMGPLAAQTLLKTNKPLIRLRGHFHEVNGIPVMPTFHPSYLIKNPEMKKATQLDLMMIRKKLGR